MNYLQILKQLRTKLASNQMSLLIGSGFSKNVNRNFPNWDELLFDLTVELHQDEIDRAFYEHIRNSVKRQRLTRSAFVKKTAGEILRNKGYLDVVSEFIRKKGHTESITSYIEDRTPVVFNKNGKLFLTIDGVTEELTHDQLVLHRSAIELPWNNIYTTNYDHLIEACADVGRLDGLKDKKRLLEAEYEVLLNEEVEVLKALSTLENQTLASNKPQSVKEELADIQHTQKPFQLSNDMQKRIDLSHQTYDLKKRKEEKEQQIRHIDVSVNQSYQVVANAAGLKLKRNRNIVKLHGSLRSAQQIEDNHFEFDSDFKKQYVISGEDYESYPRKHEAFTQLMRISLLQESFCLIGFSGVDPNFLAWVGWIRDILQKQASVNKQIKEYKIYLIDIGLGPDSSDKLLFYENHAIVRIPVRDPEVIKLIAPDNAGVALSITESLKAFINFLADDDGIIPYIPLNDQSFEQDRKRIWKGLEIGSGEVPDISEVSKAVLKLDSLSNKIFLPDINSAHTHTQHNLIGNAFNYKHYHVDDPENRAILFRLVMHAVIDYFVPIQNVIEKEIIDELIGLEDTRLEAEKLLQRSQSLTDPLTDDSANDPYEEILRLAFSLQYDQLREKLLTWNAQGPEILQKAGFLAVFDPTMATALLEQKLGLYGEFSSEQKMYALELLSMVKLAKRWKRDKKLDKLIRHYEQEGFRKISANFEYLQDQIEPEREKIAPYGKGRFSTGNSTHWVNHTKKEMAAQYITLLSQSGLPLALQGISFKNDDNWYCVFKAGFEQYPFPFLYYALQFGNDGFLKRIGQDYAFSGALTTQLPSLCKQLFCSLQTAPTYIARHVKYVLSELLVAVDPEIWEEYFLIAWKNGVGDGMAFGDRHEAAYEFFVNGIKYIQKEITFRAIVADCLDSILNQKDATAIDLLYHLNSNSFFKKLPKINDATSDFTVQVNTLIDGLVEKPGSYMFALGNIHSLLTKEYTQKIKSKLKKVDYAAIKNVRVWRILLYFMHDDRQTVKEIRQAILGHHALWYTGINGTSISGGIESIFLAPLTKSTVHSNGIKWSKKEVLFLFHKIEAVLPPMEQVIARKYGIISFEDILEDMIDFLSGYYSQLASVDNYQAIFSLTTRLYHKERDYESLSEGLLSDDQSKVVWALSEVSKDIIRGEIDFTAVGIILNKILSQTGVGLEAALSYVSSWFADPKRSAQLKGYTPYLLEILKKYKKGVFPNAHFSFVHEKLFRITFVLKEWGVEEEIVLYWLNNGRDSTFNNVRQLYMEKEGDDVYF